MTTAPDLTGDGDLRRVVGFYGLFAMCVGLNVGGGMFALIPLVAANVGPAVVVSTFIAAFPVLLALVPYSVLATGWPTTAGSYRYAKLFNRRVAFIGLATIAVLALIGGQPLFARIAGDYVAEISPLPTKLTAALALVTFYFVNVLGVRLASQIQGLLLLVMLAALGVYIGGGIDDVTAANVGALFPEGPLRTVAAAGFLYTLASGGLFVVDLGSEVREPSRVYGRALALGLGLVIVLYTLINVVTVAAVPTAELEDGTLVTVARRIMGDGAVTFFILGGALVASATTINGLFTIISRGLTVLARDGLAPEPLGRVHPRTGTPHIALTVAVVPSLVMVLAVDSLAFFGAALNFALLIGVLLVSLGGWAAAGRHPRLLEASGTRLRPATIRRVAIAVVVLNGLFIILLVPVVPAAAATVAGLLLAAFAFERVWSATHDVNEEVLPAELR